MDYLKAFGLWIFLIGNVLPVRGDFFEDADHFFATYTDNGMVLYSTLADEPATLNSLVNTVAGFSLEGKSADEQKAFYINAYNLLMIKTIVDYYPVKSPLDVKGIFSEIKHEVAGKMMTLDEIEKETLMKKFFDPRLHFVLVCGAKGCPPIASFAYLPEQIESQLDGQCRKALNNANFTRVDWQQQKVELSQIFNWYKADFLKNNSSLLDFVNEYRGQDIPLDFAVDYYQYDWRLNGKKKVR